MRAISAWGGVRLAVALCAIAQLAVVPFAPDPSRSPAAYWTLVGLCAVLISAALVMEVFLWEKVPSYAGAVGAAVAAVGAVAARWGALLVGEPDSLSATVTMISGVLLVLLFLIFRGHTAVAVAAVAGGLTVGLLMGAHTDYQNWLRLAVPPVALSMFLVVAVAGVGVRLMAGEIGLLQQSRSRSRTRVGQERQASARRRTRLDRINAQVRPLIERMADGGDLDDGDVAQARLLEARLRDGIRAPALDSPVLAVMVGEARRRGLTVTLLDDGGLDGLPDTERARAVQAVSVTLIDELERLEHGRVTARILPPGREQIAIITVHEQSGTRLVEVGPP
ncbi:hypothetical protein [Gordonia sp. VNK21]|uniref:hypothetical protein n=1 Tax=Gordonia sp. VNK21 TaxID=3382483 RepID=UPI0038D44FA7